MAIEISICDNVDETVVAALGKLIPQLSASSSLPSAEQLSEILDHDASTLLLARDGDTIVGSMTLVVFPIPTGTRAWIEDVVVDERARGQGVGEALNRRAIEIAWKAGAKTVDLTSRPSRNAGARLHRRTRFTARRTHSHSSQANGARNRHTPEQ